MSNIPISLELHNLPATIASLANVHGIPIGITSAQVHQVSFQDDGDVLDAFDLDSILDESIKQISSHGGKLNGKLQGSSDSKSLQC